MPIKQGDFGCYVAERMGFEPMRDETPLHAFQACLFSHSSTSPIRSGGMSDDGRERVHHLTVP